MIKAGSGLRILFICTLLAFGFAAFNQKASAQCAMCKAVLEGSANGAAFIKQLKIGIVVMLIPPVGIFCTVFGLAYKYRDFTHADDSINQDDADEDEWQ